MRPKGRRKPILGGKIWLMCLCAGILVGGFMIWQHIGPGVNPLPKPDTPANRNQLRITSIQEIGQALVSYFNANGSLPTPIPSRSTEICTNFGTDCATTHLADLGYLMTEGNYLPGIPEDPMGGKGNWGSGYYISKLASGQIQISAPGAELGKTIKYVTSL